MSVLKALEADDRVERILGMARRPFDTRHLPKMDYRRGDILNRTAVDDLVAEADVVVHLAFVILGTRAQSAEVNLKGSRNVFEAAENSARTRRLVYTSSLAAYGYHSENPVPLTEDVPARGSDEHYYSQQKAACEAILGELADDLEVYVLRPCIVAGPEATLLARNMPWNRLPGQARRLLAHVPLLRPVLPDPGVRFQLVHQDDVASAVREAALGQGPPGVYNLAAEDEITVTEFAHALGAAAVPVPHALASLTAGLVEAVPLLPAETEWIHAMRYPMIMDTSKARRDLGWTPQYTGHQTLEAMATAVRAELTGAR
jgi:nucleoside-diphosphate-sugar epimerase